jgi:hypothetical protein
VLCEKENDEMSRENLEAIVLCYQWNFLRVGGKETKLAVVLFREQMMHLILRENELVCLNAREKSNKILNYKCKLCTRKLV